MSDDLITILREADYVFLGGGRLFTVADDAADRIESQAAEITRLREQLVEAERQRDEARAEALEEAAKIAGDYRSTFIKPEYWPAYIADAIRARGDGIS